MTVNLNPVKPHSNIKHPSTNDERLNTPATKPENSVPLVGGVIQHNAKSKTPGGPRGIIRLPFKTTHNGFPIIAALRLQKLQLGQKIKWSIKSYAEISPHPWVWLGTIFISIQPLPLSREFLNPFAVPVPPTSAATTANLSGDIAGVGRGAGQRMAVGDTSPGNAAIECAQAK